MWPHVRKLAPLLAFASCACSADVFELLQLPSIRVDAGFDPDAAERFRDATPRPRDAGRTRDAAAPDAQELDAAAPTVAQLLKCPNGALASAQTPIRYCMASPMRRSTERLLADTIDGALTLECDGAPIAVATRVVQECLELIPQTQLPTSTDCRVSGELRVSSDQDRSATITGHAFTTDVLDLHSYGPRIPNAAPTHGIVAAAPTRLGVTAVVHDLAGALGGGFMRAEDSDLRWSTAVVPASPINRGDPAAAVDQGVVRAVWASRRDPADPPELWMATWDLDDDAFDPGVRILEGRPGIELSNLRVVQDVGGRVTVAWTQTCAAPECGGVFAMTSAPDALSFAAPTFVASRLDPLFVMAPVTGSAVIAQRFVDANEAYGVELLRVDRPSGRIRPPVRGFTQPELGLRPMGGDRLLIHGDNSIVFLEADQSTTIRAAPLGESTWALPSGAIARFTFWDHILLSEDEGASFTTIAATNGPPWSNTVPYPIMAWVSERRLLWVSRADHVFSRFGPFAGVDCSDFPHR